MDTENVIVVCIVVFISTFVMLNTMLHRKSFSSFIGALLLTSIITIIVLHYTKAEDDTGDYVNTVLVDFSVTIIITVLLFYIIVKISQDKITVKNDL